LRIYQQLGWEPGRVEVAAEAPPETAPNLFRRDGTLWCLAYAGSQVQMPDAKGLHDLVRLLGVPGREMSALEFVGADASSPGGRTGARARDAGLDGEPGDLGEVLDAQAREVFRQRLADLDAQIDGADALADLDRTGRGRAERDALVDALGSAYGLAGRSRRLGHPAERARSTVTARICDAIGKIERVHPDLGRHLRRSVRTGTLCVYDPEEPAEWVLS
jgi:hypothetical protein